MMHLVAIVFFAIGSIVSTSAVPHGLVPLSNDRIFGGASAKVGQFPYTGSLRLDGLLRCGVVLYRPDAVLTAAHCVHDLGADRMEVVVGTLYRNRGGQERWLRLYIKHNEFDPETFKNDIAIVILDGRVDYTPTTQPIALASVGEDLRGGTVATIAGWGSLNEEGHLPDSLEYVQVTIVKRSTCAALYQDRNRVELDMICAGDEVLGGKDACSGDSGGPLVVENKLYGLVSWGDDCGRADSPGVYANIGAHRQWIDSIHAPL